MIDGDLRLSSRLVKMDGFIATERESYQPIGKYVDGW